MHAYFRQISQMVICLGHAYNNACRPPTKTITINVHKAQTKLNDPKQRRAQRVREIEREGERETERGRESERERGRGRERKRE